MLRAAIDARLAPLALRGCPVSGDDLHPSSSFASFAESVRTEEPHFKNTVVDITSRRCRAAKPGQASGNAASCQHLGRRPHLCDKVLGLSSEIPNEIVDAERSGNRPSINDETRLVHSVPFRSRRRF
ncbi:hypothetical protein BIW11_04558 [Tropilaelaps mercedesae]|uniref:Uncharacterized protein n=1 Tax=Tropilaelaps mercedesae TaxID=418985 RepID=A0A1V9X4D1_9ACAR|nr:hypothetical protein BIW11_04558 [Tropilaelaps mercedesae]